MHVGDIRNPGTKAGQLFAIMCTRINGWWDAWDLAMQLKTTCVGTRCSEIRLQLQANYALGLALEHKQESEGGKPKHYYRLASTERQTSLPLPRAQEAR